MLRALLLSTTLALPVLIGVPDTAAAGVTVTYIAPEKFRDRESRQERTRASALAEFDKEFERLAARYVAFGSAAQLGIDRLSGKGRVASHGFPNDRDRFPCP